MVRQTESEGIYARRPMIYHRWGGIGSHRYQIGFSGDCFASWQVLSYLPYFTATASNVGYGYWGHDIGGHMQPKGVRETDPGTLHQMAPVRSLHPYLQDALYQGLDHGEAFLGIP